MKINNVMFFFYISCIRILNGLDEGDWSILEIVFSLIFFFFVFFKKKVIINDNEKNIDTI